MPPQDNNFLPEVYDGAYLKDLAETAVSAVVGLWDSALKTFWRSTDHRKEKGNTAETFFPTVTIRCIEALLRYTGDFSAWSNPELNQLVIEASVALLEKDEKDLHSSLGLTSEAGMLNPFTLSLYVAVLARLAGTNLLDAKQRDRARDRLETACGNLLSYSPKDGRGSGPVVHPFVLFHIVRSATAAQSATRNAETALK